MLVFNNERQSLCDPAKLHHAVNGILHHLSDPLDGSKPLIHHAIKQIKKCLILKRQKNSIFRAGRVWRSMVIMPE